MEEVYEIIEDFDRYEVSNYGTIRRRDTNYILTPYDVKGNAAVTLYDDEGRKTVYVKREVAKAFIPNPEGCTYVLAIDGDEFNCRCDNLMWSNSVGKRAHMIYDETSGLVFISATDAADYIYGNEKALLRSIRQQRPYHGHIFRLYESCL